MALKLSSSRTALWLWEDVSTPILAHLLVHFWGNPVLHSISPKVKFPVYLVVFSSPPTAQRDLRNTNHGSSKHILQTSILRLYISTWKQLYSTLNDIIGVAWFNLSPFNVTALSTRLIWSVRGETTQYLRSRSVMPKIWTIYSLG